MPNQPRTPARTVRVEDDLWQAAQEAAAERGETVSDAIRRALSRYASGRTRTARPHREDYRAMTTTARTESLSAGEQLDAIIRDLDRTSAAWVAAGYGYGTPEHEAREAVFARLKAWNVARAERPA